MGNNVAIQVDPGAMDCDVEAVPGRRAAMCGDPHEYFRNLCGYGQCKSGKNGLFYSEEVEQATRVSVHCKLVTRATRFSVYLCWLGGVKMSLCRKKQMRGRQSSSIAICEAGGKPGSGFAKTASLLDSTGQSGTVKSQPIRPRAQTMIYESQPGAVFVKRFPRFVMVQTLVWCCLVICLCLNAVSVKAAPAQPNIVVVLVDDLRWDELGCMGHPFVRTPHIDRISREGARFRNAFCSTPLCSPVRACLLTGRYTHNHGIFDNINRSEHSHTLKTFPQELQKAGYATAYVGKWHMGNDDTARPGFDYWVSMKGQGTSFDPTLNVNGERIQFTGHTTDALNQKVNEFVSAQNEKPFCIYIAHKALHPELTQRDDGSITDPSAAKFMPAKRHEKLYSDDAIPRRLNVMDTLEGKRALKRSVPGLPPLSQKTGTDDGVIRDRLRMLAGIDEGVGLLCDLLESQGKLDDTVIVFTSDHGYWYGEHGLSVERRLPYEEGIRVPLLVRYPPVIKAGTVIDEFAVSVDLAPTMLDLAHVKSDQKYDGRSLVPLLKGEHPADWRQSFLVEYNSDTVFPRLVKMGYTAVRTPRWKYIQFNELTGMNELYDMLRDPYEMQNLINDPAAKETVKQLQAELKQLMKD